MSGPLREALERIANQGTGHLEGDPAVLLSDDGSGRPWLHWAQIAREALAIEPEYEWRIARDGKLIQHADDERDARNRAHWFSPGTCVERRVRSIPAGPWERVDA